MSSNVLVVFNTNQILIKAYEDIPRCDLTIIQIRRNTSPSTTPTPMGPVVQRQKGILAIEYVKFIPFSQASVIKFLPWSAMDVIHITSISKGDTTFTSWVQGGYTNRSVSVDQTPHVVFFSTGSAIDHKFVGNAISKASFVDTMVNGFFAESTNVLPQDPLTP